VSAVDSAPREVQTGLKASVGSAVRGQELEKIVDFDLPVSVNVSNEHQLANLRVAEVVAHV